MKKIAILGAGISGLTIAWYLKQKYQQSIEIVLHEKSDRVGGLIRTFVKNQFLFEAGPRGFRPTGKGEATLRLVKELGLESFLIPSSGSAYQRFVGLHGKLQRVNIGFLARHGLVSALYRDFVTPASPFEDETVENFAKRRFHPKIGRYLLDPLMKGIFGGDYQELSIRHALPLLWNFDQQYGSVLKGFWAGKKKNKGRRGLPALFSFKEGMEMLPQKLASQLELPISFQSPIRSWNEVEADYIISTLPLYAFKNGKDLVEYKTLSSVHLGWNQKVFHKTGFGFLLPTCEKSPLLGITWDSEVFPHHNWGNQTRLTAMIGGSDDEQNLIHQTLYAVKKYMNISIPPDFYECTTALQAVPQYKVFHHRTLETFKKELPTHVFACGMAFEGIGVNDAIANAESFVSHFSL